MKKMKITNIWKRNYRNYTKLSSVFLRDHCKCSKCFDSQTNQRIVNTLELLQNEELSIDPSQSIYSRIDGGDTEDGYEYFRVGNHTVKIERELIDDGGVQDENSGLERIAWDSSFEVPEVQYQDLFDENGLRSLMESMEVYGICSVSGIPSDDDLPTKEVCERIGILKNSFYEPFWSFENDAKLADTAYTNLEIENHTDNTYWHHPSRYLLLHCVQYEATGGDSVFIDGQHVCNELQKTHPEVLEYLTNTKLSFQYKDSERFFLTEKPILQMDGDKLIQLTYNNHDRTFQKDLDSKSFYEAFKVFGAAIQKDEYAIKLTMQPGKAYIFDNFRLLHGRKSFIGSRRVIGAYIDHDSIESLKRVLL